MTLPTASAQPPTSGIAYAMVILGIVAASGGILFIMGRVPWCECGTIKLWYGVVMSSENSQHLSDWYSPSHIVHGLLFYAGLWAIGRRWPLGLRAIIATLIEAAWEVVENTDFIINRYRESTIALDYYGDSVVNSLADIGFMLAGFLIAARAPVWFSVALGIVLELLCAWLIRDNLTFNVIMLLYPLDGIRQWQMGE